MSDDSNSKGRDDVAKHLERLRADFATLSETVTRLVSESAASARAQVRETASDAARKASDAGQQVYRDAAALGHDAIGTANAAAGELEKQITRNPMTAVLAALGIGLAIGLLHHRRR